jgi:hypothetical protein
VTIKNEVFWDVLHAPHILPPRTECPAFIGKEAVWASDSVWVLWRRKNLLPFPRIETRFLGHPACSLTSVPTELPRLPF